MVLKSGASSLLVRDAMRRPLAELELGEVSAGLSRSSPAVMQVLGGMVWKALHWVFVIMRLKNCGAGAGQGWPLPLRARQHEVKGSECHQKPNAPYLAVHCSGGAGLGVCQSQKLTARRQLFVGLERHQNCK